jgi:hypothetical protein
MKEMLDFVESCEANLASLGYELVDLGTDLDTNAHCYSIFQKSSGELISYRLMSIREVVAFLDNHARAGFAHHETKKAG